MKPTLVRAVSRWEIVGIAINDVIGSGVYLLPAAAAALLGAASTGAVLLAGIAVALLVLCFAEAGSYFDEPGGGYLYTREAFGRFIGFEVGWMTWLARVSSMASLANGFALATSFLWPAAATDTAVRFAVITAPLLLLALINVVGVKAGARTAVLLTLGKLIPLVLFVGIGIFFIDWNLVTAFETPRPEVLGEAALLLLFAYAGFENTAAAAGEFRNPQRDVPFALLTMIVVVTLIYTAVQVVALGTLPDVASTSSPLAAAAARVVGTAGALVMSVGAMISILGNIGSSAFAGPRYLFALARDGFGPVMLSRVQPRFRTPAVAILTHIAIAWVLALSGSFVQLAMLSVIARLSTYIGTAAALPVLRRRFGDRPGALRLPGGSAIPVAALTLSVALLASARPSNLLAAGAALIIGAALYPFARPPMPDTPSAAHPDDVE